MQQQQEASINLDADLEGIISLARRHIQVLKVNINSYRYNSSN